MSGLRIAFFGSPAFAIPVLEALMRHHRVVLAVTQPDKPAGRGLTLSSPAVARRAREAGIDLQQPRRLRGNEPFKRRLEGLDFDLAVTAAYGNIVPVSLLTIPRYGFLNVHASLLPKYRGAAPIQWALIRGERETGVTIMQTDKGLDTGAIRYQRRLPIEADDDAESLSEKLAGLGATAMIEALDLLAEDRLPCHPQDDAEATLAPLLTKEDGLLDWHRPASEIHARYRGVAVWPGTWWRHQGRVVRVERMEPSVGSGPPGQVLEVNDSGVLVATGRQALLLVTVKPAGKRAMSARDWANGYGVGWGTDLE